MFRLVVDLPDPDYSPGAKDRQVEPDDSEDHVVWSTGPPSTVTGWGRTNSSNPPYWLLEPGRGDGILRRSLNTSYQLSGQPQLVAVIDNLLIGG